MERKQKDLKGLEATISEYEYDLGRARPQPENTPVSDDGQSNPGTEGAMAITPVVNDAPPASTAPESLTSPPGEEQTLPWRWMMGMSTKPQPAPSPMGRMSS